MFSVSWSSCMYSIMYGWTDVVNVVLKDIHTVLMQHKNGYIPHASVFICFCSALRASL